MFGSKTQPCRQCGRPIKGYVDECPGCGTHKPVPVPVSYYVAGAVIAVAIIYFASDFERVITYFGGRLASLFGGG